MWDFYPVSAHHTTRDLLWMPELKLSHAPHASRFSSLLFLSMRPPQFKPTIILSLSLSAIKRRRLSSPSRSLDWSAPLGSLYCLSAVPVDYRSLSAVPVDYSSLSAVPVDYSSLSAVSVGLLHLLNQSHTHTVSQSVGTSI